MDTVKFIILIFLFTVSIKTTNAQNSVVLDSTFGVNGKTSTTISPEGNLNSLPSSIRQDDGKIIVAYQFSNYPVLLRYLPDGDLDSTWGQNGIVRTIDSTSQRNVVLDLHLLDNDQVLLTGYRYLQSGGGFNNIIIKYNSDGSLDQSFGINGTANYAHPIDIIPSPSATLFVPRSSFVLGAKIYVAGTDNYQNNYGFIAFDLNTGALDTTFGNNNRLSTDFGWNNNTASHIVCRTTDDNKIRAFIGYRVYQLLPDFQVDTNGGFGNNGFIEFPCGITIGSGGGIAHGLEGFSIVKPNKDHNKHNESFFVTSLDYGGCNLNNQGIVAKYHSNGDLDISFANNGMLNFDFRRDTTERTYINSVRVLSNDYILVSGGIYKNTYEQTTGKVTKQFAMALFDSNGNPINSFGNFGNVYRENYFHTTDSIDYLTNSFIQEDDKIVLVGFTPHFYIYDPSPQGLLEGNMSVILSRYTIQGISEGGGVDLNQETKNNFTIYPNPTNSILNIQSDKVIQKVSIYNYLGELVIQENGQALNQINVEQLNKGIYVIRMTGKDGNVFNGKFVKE